MVWQMTLGQIIRYTKVAERMIVVHNPFAESKKEQGPTDPAVAIQMARSMGLVRD